jgi:opacity protein-like surface antigen
MQHFELISTLLQRSANPHCGHPGFLKYTQKHLHVVVIWLCFFALGRTEAQQIFQNGQKLPLIVVRAPYKQVQSMIKNIENLPSAQKAQYHFWVFSSTDTKFEQVFNDLLNGPKSVQVDMQRIYLVELTTDIYAAPTDYNKRIFAEVFKLKIAENQEIIDIGNVITKLQKANNYLWEVELSTLRKDNREVLFKQKKLLLGVMLGQGFPRIQTDDTFYLPKRVTNYGLHVGYNFNKRLQLLAKLAVSVKLPNQSALQSSIFNQIDISAGGEQTISAEMKMHIIGQGALQANYLFRPNRPFKPYVGAGLSMNLYTSANLKIEQTINVSELSGGGGPPNLGSLGGGDPTGDLPLSSRRFMTPQLSTGFNHALNNHVEFTFNANYQLPKKGTSIDDGREYQERMTGLSFNVGLQFNFGRTRYYYHYLKKLP